MNVEQKCENVLRKFFKFSQFKSPLQKQAILEIAKNANRYRYLRSRTFKRFNDCIAEPKNGDNDVVVLMPTGSGKSLCYQLPGLLFETKVAVVFSPLLSLIKDQIDHLLALNIRAVTINSMSSPEERASILNDLLGPVKTRFLFITPELAATNTFKDVLVNLFRSEKISFVVVDEAHCVSEWGHDFRPDYLRLSKIRFDENVPVIALTATANKNIIEDIKKGLSLRSGFKLFRTTCFRQNLFYDVVFQELLDDPYEDLAEFIKKCLKDQPGRPSGIIYCRTREQTEVIPCRLSKFNIECGTYHGGLKKKDRQTIQERWYDGELAVICATISFGMGVDKADVRVVVHWGVPKDPASYYQESGRAGRDGLPAFCRVYYSRGDRSTVNYLLMREKGATRNDAKARKISELNIENFHKIVQFIESPTNCRHKLFTDHFGDEFEACKKHCDFCKDPKTVQKMADYVCGGGGSGSRGSRKKKGVAKNKLVNDSSDSLYGDGRYDNSYNDYENESSEMVERSTTSGGGDSTAFIKATFAARRLKVQSMMKTNGGAGNDSDDVSSLVYNGRVIKPQFTASKIIDLTNASRELYVRKILHELVENKKIVENVTGFDEGTAADSLMNIAANMEYEIFSTKRTISTYRSGCVKIVRDIRVATSCRKVYDCSMNESYCYNTLSQETTALSSSSSSSLSRKRTATTTRTGRKTTRRKRKSLGRGKSTSKSPKKSKRTAKKYSSSSNSSFAFSSPTATKSSKDWLQVGGGKTTVSDWKKRKINYADDEFDNDDVIGSGENAARITNNDPVIVLDTSDDEQHDFVPKRNRSSAATATATTTTTTNATISQNNSVVNLVTSSTCSSTSNSRTENDSCWNAIETPPALKTNFSFKQSALVSPTNGNRSNNNNSLPTKPDDMSIVSFVTPTKESIGARPMSSSTSAAAAAAAAAALATPTFRSSALLMSEQLSEEVVTPQFEKKVAASVNDGLVAGASAAPVSTLSKQQLGTMVIRILTPAYCEKKFKDREHFKDTVRRISSAILLMQITDSSKIKTFTEDYVQKHL